MLFEKKFHPIALCWGDRLASFSNNIFHHATSTLNGKTADYTWRSLTFYSLHFRFYSSNLSNNELCNQSTTDAQRGNSLHCTAQNAIPIPSF